jgi:glycosyltransferase involved in cell wall biosynthesis
MVSGVSVIVCSYNGATNLPATLHHLCRQLVKPKVLWEILVINNASTDNTFDVAKKVLSEYNPEVPYFVLDEPRPGKNNAVDTGLRLAKYRYVLICDDDNWLAHNYVQTAFDIMQANPQIGMLGGKGIPEFEGKPPIWFGTFQNYYAVGQQNPESGEVSTSKGFLWGAGAVINKAAYQRLIEAGFKRIITYERYPRLARGEDVELCLAISLTGYKIWYSNSLVYRHFIGKDKLDWNFLLRLTREGGLAGPLVRPYQELIRARKQGYANVPTWVSWLWKRNKRGADLSNALLLQMRNRKDGDLIYQKRLARHYYFLGLLNVCVTYNSYLKQVTCLKERLDSIDALSFEEP